VLASVAFSNLIAQLRTSYDYIIIDFPPIAPVVDVRATTQIVDSYVFVIEWGRTKVNLIQDQLKGSPELYEKILGVVLNKTNMKVLQRYEANYGKDYYKQYYSVYGYSS
jgi:succinoglycan biosynthesis transport protein ExoP